MLALHHEMQYASGPMPTLTMCTDIRVKQRRLGQSGPRVSIVGYGAMSLTDFYGPATDKGSFGILRACLEHGITHIDTSKVYGMGRSETVIGNWLRQRRGEPLNDCYEGRFTRLEGRQLNNERAHLEESLDASLSRLGVEAVDLC